MEISIYFIYSSFSFLFFFFLSSVDFLSKSTLTRDKQTNNNAEKPQERVQKPNVQTKQRQGDVSWWWW